LRRSIRRERLPFSGARSTGRLHIGADHASIGAAIEELAVGRDCTRVCENGSVPDGQSRKSSAQAIEILYIHHAARDE
jgi:hypothetical protein